jgi:hypothetical protein
MSKFKVGDKVALARIPRDYLGCIKQIYGDRAVIKSKDIDEFHIDLDCLVLYDETDMYIDDIYDMLKPKLGNILHWSDIESIKNDPFPSQILEWIGNNTNVRYQQYCTELDIKHAIALAYRSGYLRAKKGRPFKIGGEKE